MKQRFSFCAFVREFNFSFPFWFLSLLYLLSLPLPLLSLSLSLACLPVAISFSTLDATVDLLISLLGNPFARAAKVDVSYFPVRARECLTRCG
jgi:hypothetical protein